MNDAAATLVHESITPALAARFAASTAGHVMREFPYKADHVMGGPQDALRPSALHPIFHGSFDWHSCCHGWWQLLRLMRLFPGIDAAQTIRALADASFTPEKVAGELAYFQRPLSGGSSRPYGRAWLLALHAEASRHDAPWATALEPLARHMAQSLHTYLSKLTYPLRVGTHFNSAFACLLSLHWARDRDDALTALIREKALEWFGHDRACQAWEPGGDEFLSPALSEAMLMSRLLDQPAFAHWFDAFLPDIAVGQPATLFTPAIVSDRSDGKIAHLDGLNLSRAWCWRGIAGRLPENHAARHGILTTARAHLDAALPHLFDDYMGEHWLATYALLALDPAQDI